MDNHIIHGTSHLPMLMENRCGLIATTQSDWELPDSSACCFRVRAGLLLPTAHEVNEPPRRFPTAEEVDLDLHVSDAPTLSGTSSASPQKHFRREAVK